MKTEATCLVAGSCLIVAFNDYYSYPMPGGHFVGYSASTDGGGAFDDKGLLPNGPDGDGGDPSLARDNISGAIYLATLAFNTDDNLEIFKSIDNGQTFAPAVVCTPGSVMDDSQDKEWIAVDNYPGPGQGSLYVFWR